MKVRQDIRGGVRALKPGPGIDPWRAVTSVALAAGLLLVGPANPAIPPASPFVPDESAAPYRAPLRTAIQGLAVSDEENVGYDRDRYFGQWADADGDCRNTRQEVLAAESQTRPSYSKDGCEVTGGRWVTTWDNRIHTSPSTVQIDHTVPVHEAWGSGARYWSQSRRVAYLNDLGDPRALTVQTTALNVDKNGQGPQNWMPPANRCAYIEQWVAVKIRWGLSIDVGEKAALVHYANACPNVVLTLRRV
jgi:hypothetical protein